MYKTHILESTTEPCKGIIGSHPGQGRVGKGVLIDDEDSKIECRGAHKRLVRRREGRVNQTDGVEGPGLEPFCRVTIGSYAQHRSHISDYRRPHLRLLRLQALDDDDDGDDDGSAHTAVSNTFLCSGASA